MSYKKEAYDNTLAFSTVCLVKGCNKLVVNHEGIWVNVCGNGKTLWFCPEHEAFEREKEKCWELGL